MFDFDKESVNEAYVNAYKDFLRINLSRQINLTFIKVLIKNQNPLMNQCFENVNRYVNDNEDYSAQYGWMVFEDDELNHVTFEAHGVIKNNITQALYEITPTLLKLPFLKSMILDPKFEELVRFLHLKNGNARIKISK